MTRTGRRRFVHALATGTITSVAGCVSLPRLDTTFDPLDETALDRHASTQFRGNLLRHGYVDRAVPERVAVAWSLPTNRGEHTAAKASPVATPDGDLLVSGDTGAVRRVTPAGEVKWTARTESTERGIHGTPAIANGEVYVGAYDGAVYAFDLATGERRWRNDLGIAIGSSPGYYNGVLYVGVEYAQPDGSVAAVDAATGDVRWMGHRPTDHPHSTPGLDVASGRLVIGSNDGVCYAWSFPELELEWTFETGGSIKGPIAIVDGRAVFGSWDHTVYALALDDGSVGWTFEAGADVMSGPAVTPNGTVYVGSHDDNLYALDGRTGEEHWRFETDGWIIGSVTATRGHVLVGSQDARLYAVERETGTETWHVTGNGDATSAPLVHDGAVYYSERATDETPGMTYRVAPD